MNYKPKALSLAAVVAFLGCLPAPRARADDAAEQLAAISALFEAKKYNDAAAKIQTFLTAYPKHARVAAAGLTLGHCFAATQQWTKAMAAYEKAAAAGDASVTPEARLRQGVAAVNAGQYDKAVAPLEKAVDEDLTRAQKGAALFYLGQANFQLGKFPAAEQAYQRVITDYKQVDFLDSAMLGSGLSAMRQGKTEDARIRLRGLISRFPQSEERVRARLAIAQLDADAKSYPQARAGYQAVLDDELSKRLGAEVLVPAEEGLIHVLLESGDYATASSRLEDKMRKLPPGDPQRQRVSLALGHARYRQHQLDTAYTAYVEASKSTDGSVGGEGIYWAGNVLLAQGKKVDAGNQFKELPARFPTHPLAAKAALKAGDAFSAAGKSELAGAAYRTVVEKYAKSDQAVEAKRSLNGLTSTISDPVQLAAAIKGLPAEERPAAQLRLARMYFEAKKYPEMAAVITEIQQGTAPAAVKGEAKYLSGLASEAKGASAPAAAALTEALALAPAAEWAAHAQGRLAWLQLDLKQPAKAEAAANAAIKLSPPADIEQDARLALMQAQLDLKKWDAALETSRIVLAANPSQETVATVVFTHAWATEQSGKPEEALPMWERLASEFPKSPYAPDALLRVGDARLKDEKYEEARTAYETLVKNFPTSPLKSEARFKLGSALFNLTKYSEAVVEFDAVAGDKTAADFQPEALYWAGVAYDKAGAKDKAVLRLQRLVTDFPKHSRVSNAKIRLAGLKAAGN